MADNEKKVIAFVVEGPSDEAALGTIMQEHFANERVKFLVVHGDITTRDYVSIDSIVKRINGLLENAKKKYMYTTSDFLQVIHLADTDGVYVPDESVIQKEANAESGKSSILYFEDHMEADNVEVTIQRNRRKADILFKLRKTGKIGTIPYRIYYNSCNLEHVLYDELKDFTDEKKEEMSDDFAEKYEGKVEEFITFISQQSVAVPGTYKETWKYIEKELNSLNRHSNMHQIFSKSQNKELLEK